MACEYTPEQDCDGGVHGVHRDDLDRAPGQQDGGVSCCSYDDYGVIGKFKFKSLEVIGTAQKTMDGTEFHDVTITVEDDKEDKIIVKAYDVKMDTIGDELRVETCEEG